MKLKFTPIAFFIFVFTLAIPAYLINLGEQPSIDDEAIRAIVAFEMETTGDYITPTIAGEIYLKKPPLFNWLIIGSYRIFNNYSDLPVRMPMIMSLFLFTLAIFYFFRKELNTETAVISSLLFLTCGRVLLYESQYGLIDLTFSMLTFIFFMTLYRNFNRGNLLRMFVVAYLITAISFLLKGLPSVVFLGITLLVLLISQRKFKLLFNWSHFAGIFVFIIIVGSYYVAYFMRNHIPVEDLVNVLVGETTRRTPVRFGFWKTILHLFQFPFEVVYHFLPWTLLSLVFFKKGIFQKIRKNHFLYYISLVFVFNIIVYWISPEVYPRYILMLMPVFFGITTYFYLETRNENSLSIRIIEIIFGVVIGIATIAGFAPLFIDIKNVVAEINWYAAGFIVIFLCLNFIFWKYRPYRIYSVILAMIIVRLVFSSVIIPVRLSNSKEMDSKRQAFALIEKIKDNELYFYWNPAYPDTGYYGRVETSYRYLYHLVQARNKMITISTERDLEVFYIAPKYTLKIKEINIIEEFTPAGHESPVVLFKFKNPELLIN
jgi:4-amino-4-deoxy-L-arabinose transferase-like glycosyltransferase